jgi:hypothetical protein
MRSGGNMGRVSRESGSSIQVMAVLVNGAIKIIDQVTVLEMNRVAELIHRVTELIDRMTMTVQVDGMMLSVRFVKRGVDRVIVLINQMALTIKVKLMLFLLVHIHAVIMLINQMAILVIM